MAYYPNIDMDICSYTDTEELDAYGNLVKDAFKDGAEWQKTQMMKDAVEGINDCPYRAECPVRDRMQQHA